MHPSLPVSFFQFAILYGSIRMRCRGFRVGLGKLEDIRFKSWTSLLLRLGSCWRNIGKGQVSPFCVPSFKGKGRFLGFFRLAVYLNQAGGMDSGDFILFWVRKDKRRVWQGRGRDEKCGFSLRRLARRKTDCSRREGTRDRNRIRFVLVDFLRFVLRKFR